MKIAPLPPTGMPQHSAEEKPMTPARIPMRVNQTPGRISPAEMQAGASPVAADGAALSIPPSSETSAEKDEATQPLSPQLAALARERRALQQERQALEREKAQRAQSATQTDAISLDRLKSEPLSVLLENGVTYDQLTEQILAQQNGVSTTQIKALMDEIKALKEGVDTKFTERDQQQETRALDQMVSDARRILAADENGEFEAIKAENALPQVRELIRRTYKEEGEVLDVREAMELIENELIEDGLKRAQLKKVQAKLAPPPPDPQPQQRQMRTLTNRDTASVPLSAKARAIAAFNGTLRR